MKFRTFDFFESPEIFYINNDRQSKKRKNIFLKKTAILSALEHQR